MKCPACGYELPEKTKVCIRCGSRPDEHIGVNRATGPAFSSGNKLQPGAGGSSLPDKLFNPRDYSKSNMSGTPQARQTKTGYYLIWLSMVMSLFMYYACLYFVTMGKNKLGGVQPSQIVLYVIIMAGVINWIAGLFVSAQALSPDRLRFSKDKNQLRQNIFTKGVIGLALIESVAICGLLLVFMGFVRNIFFPFMASSLIGMLLHLKYAKAAWDFHDSIPDEPADGGK